MITVQINCKITENIWNVDVEKWWWPWQGQTVPHCEKEKVCDQINCQQAISN